MLTLIGTVFLICLVVALLWKELLIIIGVLIVVVVLILFVSCFFDGKSYSGTSYSSSSSASYNDSSSDDFDSDYIYCSSGSSFVKASFHDGYVFEGAHSHDPYNFLNNIYDGKYSGGYIRNKAGTIVGVYQGSKATKGTINKSFEYDFCCENGYVKDRNNHIITSYKGDKEGALAAAILFL